MTIDTPGIIRFLKYSAIGGSTFASDLALLIILTDMSGWDPIWASGLSFTAAISANYFLSRRFVFTGSLRSAHSGYGIFFLIALSGLAFVMGSMAILVGVFGWNFILSRIIIAGITGFWNYLLNLYVNFKVVGKHIKKRDGERTRSEVV